MKRRSVSGWRKRSAIRGRSRNTKKTTDIIFFTLTRCKPGLFLYGFLHMQTKPHSSTAPEPGKIVAIIPAAGLGRRMGGSVSKQYLCLDGIPILVHCLRVFASHPAIAEIIIVTSADQLDFCRHDIVHAYNIDKVKAVVCGGAQRQDSVRAGLRACNCHAYDLVLIHDGVRPLVQAQTIDRVIAGTRQSGACIAGVPLKDTVKIVADGIIQTTPERSSLWAAQTPQGFRYGLIRDAHEHAFTHGIEGTDDASLVECCQQPVHVVEGMYSNLKITTPEDMVLAQALLHNRED